MRGKNRVIYTVKDKKQETENVVTLFISTSEPVSYKGGQYVTIFFDDSGYKEGKAYTLSSSPHENTLAITIKDIGVFSHRLCSLKISESFEGSLPYGYFYSEDNNTDLIMIAGGIGVTPFRSMIVDNAHNLRHRNSILFYSNKTKKDSVFLEEFRQLMMTYPNFVLHPYITQEKGEDGFIEGRISIDDILEKTSNYHNKEFLLCGSISFVRDYWRLLKERGVPEETIYTEAFF